MPLGTLDRRAPSFMRQGPSAISQLVLYSALALFLMVADARFHVTDPLRKVIAAVLYPAQWAMIKPVEMAGEAAGYFETLQAAQSESDLARKQLALQSQRAHQADQLAQENDRLRQLLDLRARLQGASQAAQILYET
ncbi:MAG TPA: rod shape-determining protein MreC, partial [Giesbergeria sp.]|nr:rod shape-determining protein MreC [Giesbergeria sp.]